MWCSASILDRRAQQKKTDQQPKVAQKSSEISQAGLKGAEIHEQEPSDEAASTGSIAESVSYVIGERVDGRRDESSEELYWRRGRDSNPR